MSADAVLWIVMAFCLIVGCPIFVSLGVASTLALILTNIPMRIVALDMLKVMDMFPLLAVVGFIFAGALMEKGGMARQIVDVASLFVGRIRGGLGITTILGCLFFAAMIGSGPGTVAAMGSIMIPTMVRRGYSPEYAAGVCATGGTLGILIPPSNPMIIYGVVANTSFTTKECGSATAINKTLQTEAADAFLAMQAAAAKDGVTVWMQSGYRSVDYQKNLYDKKTQYFLEKGKGGCGRQPAGLFGAQLRPCRRPEQPGAHRP